MLVVEAIRGIVERSTYRNLEFVVVADAETPDDVVTALEELCGDRLRLVLWDAPFNFSAKMNRGAVVAGGEYLLLLNDDVEVVTDDWIETLLGLAQQDGVGIVGAQLYFEDSTVQHAGQIYTGGVAGHAAFGWTGGRDDSIKSMSTDHEVSGVTAACSLISRDLYVEVGGFTLAAAGQLQRCRPQHEGARLGTLRGVQPVGAAVPLRVEDPRPAHPRERPLDAPGSMVASDAGRALLAHDVTTQAAPPAARVARDPLCAGEDPARDGVGERLTPRHAWVRGLQPPRRRGRAPSTRAGRRAHEGALSVGVMRSGSSPESSSTACAKSNHVASPEFVP